MAKIGYKRTSTIKQGTDRQLEGLELNKVFIEKISAKQKNRPILEECVNYLREKDVLYVHSQIVLLEVLEI